jgi:outer membrane biosynthesis protein TonB
MAQRYNLSTARSIIFFLVFILVVACSEKMYAQEFFPASSFGGKQQLREFLDEHLIYPAFELNVGKEGNVALAFDVDIYGLVSQLKVLQTVSPAITQEAIRLFKLLLWKPAIYRGKVVADHQELTIPFNIKHYHKLCRLRGYDTLAFPFRPADTSNKIYSYRQIDIAPVPVFTEKNLSYESFMRQNFHYPDLAFKQNISGIVIVNFVVEPYGLISNVNVENRLGAGCTEEAIRLVKLLKWMPGKANGTAVRVMMNLSITFSLDGKNKFDYQPNQASNTMN